MRNTLLGPVAEAIEVAPSLAAGLVATAILLPANWVIRGAKEPLEAGRFAAFAGTVALTGLLLFAFLCARGVEWLSLLEGLRDGGSQALDDPVGLARNSAFAGLSAGHAVLVTLALFLLAFLILRASTDAARLRGSVLVRGAAFLVHLVSLLWIGLLLAFYVL
ncbi:MAG: hypothetical protein AAGG01_24275 [Planctomycetota bacterium]